MAERRTIIFSGRVQGVGFRMTAVHLARDLPLSGTVRNTDDGSVEMVVQGSPKDIDALVTRLREHFGAFIRTINQNSTPMAGDAGEGPGIRITH